MNVAEAAMAGIFGGKGGGGGDVTKEYVDTAIANAVADKVDKVEGKGLSTNDYTNADKALVQGSPITSTSTTSPLTDSADGFVQEMTIYGRSEVVDGAIKSIGDAGWGVVDLGTLTWVKGDASIFYVSFAAMANNKGGICAKYVAVLYYSSLLSHDKCFVKDANGYLYIKDTEYENSDATTFKSAMFGVLLYYPLADTTGATPTFGITSKNGEGQGTAATITTGLPLRSVSDSIFDTLDNEKVSKKCGRVFGRDLTWDRYSFSGTYAFYATVTNAKQAPSSCLSDAYTVNNTISSVSQLSDKECSMHITNNVLYVRDDTYTDVTTFAAAVADAEFLYELATPTETPLTSAEKSALASLRTYDHTTYIDATDAPTMTVNYLLDTDNGQAVANIQRDLREQIDDKITVSPLLTLSVAGWNSTTLQQTVTFVHDATKRNVIDVDPASVEEWAACGIIARYETASNITFTCKSIPENALSFKVTSMGV